MDIYIGSNYVELLFKILLVLGVFGGKLVWYIEVGILLLFDLVKLMKFRSNKIVDCMCVFEVVDDDKDILGVEYDNDNDNDDRGKRCDKDDIYDEEKDSCDNYRVGVWGEYGGYE